MNDTCELCTPDMVLIEDELAYVRYDNNSLSKGHVLAVPRRHVADFFDMTAAEKARDPVAARPRQDRISHASMLPTATTSASTSGSAGGQSRMHVHVHLIPRYTGDVADPRGGIRCVLTKQGVTAASVAAVAHENKRRLPMARFLKRGMDASEIKAADAKVRETVEGILAQVEDAQGRRDPRAVAEIRQLVAGLVPADAAGDRTRDVAGRQARPRRHPVRAGAGAQLRAEADATPCRTSRWKRCPASCSATSTSR